MQDDRQCAHKSIHVADKTQEPAWDTELSEVLVMRLVILQKFRSAHEMSDICGIWCSPYKRVTDPWHSVQLLHFPTV